MRHQLFVYRNLFGWLNEPFEGSPQLADLAARGESTEGRAHGACGDLGLRSRPAELKARGGGDAGTSL